jgi:hypothetical protein
VVSTPDEVFVHSVEDLIDFTITEIQEPLDLIPETPVADVSEPNDFLEEEEFDSDPEDMEDENNHEEEREILIQNNQPWLAEMPWPSLDGHIIFPGTRRSCFPSTIPRLQVYLKIISRIHTCDQTYECST